MGCERVEAGGRRIGHCGSGCCVQEGHFHLDIQAVGDITARTLRRQYNVLGIDMEIAKGYRAELRSVEGPCKYSQSPPSYAGNPNAADVVREDSI